MKLCFQTLWNTTKQTAYNDLVRCSLFNYIMHYIQEANLKPFKSLYTHNSNYIQSESRQEGSVILEKSSQGTASICAKTRSREESSQKKGKSELMAKITRDAQGHTGVVFWKDPGAGGREAGAGRRGGERKGVRLLTSCCQWRSVSGAEPWLAYRNVWVTDNRRFGLSGLQKEAAQS